MESQQLNHFPATGIALECRVANCETAFRPMPALLGDPGRWTDNKQPTSS